MFKQSMDVNTNTNTVHSKQKDLREDHRFLFKSTKQTDSFKESKEKQRKAQRNEKEREFLLHLLPKNKTLSTKENRKALIETKKLFQEESQRKEKSFENTANKTNHEKSKLTERTKESHFVDSKENISVAFQKRQKVSFKEQRK